MRVLVYFLIVVVALTEPAAADETTKDHVSDRPLWSSTGVILNAWGLGTGPSPWGLFQTACTFVGNGENVARVGGIFTSGTQSVQPSGPPGPVMVTQGQWWNNVFFELRIWPSEAAFLTGPNIPPTAVIYQPSNAAYWYPAGYSSITDPSGLPFPLHYLEFDVAGLSLVTTQGATHVISLIARAIVTTAGSSTFTGLATSNGGPGSIGASPDYFQSDLGTQYATPVPLNQLPGLSAISHAAYKVVLDEPTKPYFSLDITSAATTLRIQNNPLFGSTGLDFSSFQWLFDGVDLWPVVVQSLISFPQFFTFSQPNPDEFELTIWLDLRAFHHRFTGCDIFGICHTTP